LKLKVLVVANAIDNMYSRL